ncbi:Tad domain-containing protein [Idiomarina seosinensis]|nr:Tad domain-containing protein [Idiomarina seosinensis]
MTHQRGQTLMLMAVAVFLMVLLLIAATRMGEHARRQWYMQSVADNAAHSGAVLMARQLNLSAILNRALIGNQVAMGQWVGLASWMAMITRFGKNASWVIGLIPGLQAAAIKLNSIVGKAEQMTDKSVQVLLYFHSGVIKAISLAQVGLETSMIVETPFSVHKVIEQHDEKLEASLYQGGSIAPFPGLWWRFTDSHSTRNKKSSEFFKQLTLKSRDPFTTRRTYRWGSIKLLKLEKAGGNELQSMPGGRWNWNALDSLAVHAYLPNPLGWGWEVVKAAGWGARAAYSKYRRSRWYHKSYGNAFKVNKWVSRTGWNAMRSFRVQTLPFSYLRLREGNPYGAHAIVVKISDPETQQVTHARAEVHFSRPLSIFPRGDRKQEKANLFNALWEPKLVPLTATDKVTIAAREIVIDD